MKDKIFLGGTCAETDWREKLIASLNSDIEYFNPVVPDWTPECQDIEELEKKIACNIHVYVLTKEMIGVYSIAEVIESTNTPGKITILQVMPDGFSTPQLKSLKAVIGLVKKNGGIAYMDQELNRLLRILNYSFGN